MCQAIVKIWCLNKELMQCFGTQSRKKIESMPSGENFLLKDLIDTPPSNLGVKLYAHQKELGIEIIKKDSSNTNMFKKL